MKVLFISGREPNYMRNRVLIKGMRESGCEVVECTSDAGSYLKRISGVIGKFLSTSKADVDVVFVGYFGQPLVPVIRLFTRKPIVFDAFLSAYDTLCYDRKLFKPHSIPGRAAYYLDKISCRLADLVLLDTNAHIDYFVDTFKCKREKFRRAFVGADEGIFHPVEYKKQNAKIKIFYYTTYHPLHGVEYIVRAAHLLKNEPDIEFDIVGRGMEYNRIHRLAEELNLKGINFIASIPSKEFYHAVVPMIAQSDICLGGHFSNVDKAKRTIAEKTFQFIAMRKPVILGDNSANRELFKDRRNSLMCEMANPDALAAVILELKNDAGLRTGIAEEGYKTFIQNCTIGLIGEETVNILKRLTGE